MFSALYRYWLKSKVHYSRLYILCSACSLYMFCMFLLHALHVPLACSTCSFYMFSMFKGHVQHAQRTCSACTFCLFSMFKVDVLLVPFACSVCHFTFTLRTSVSHNSLKSSPISMIFIYMCLQHLGLELCTICEKIYTLFYAAASCKTKQPQHP